MKTGKITHKGPMYQSPFPVDTSFEKKIFMDTPLIRDYLEKLINHMDDHSITGLVDSCK